MRELGMKTEIKDLTKRVDSLEPKPPNQKTFSAPSLVLELKKTLKQLTETYGPNCLTNHYGVDHTLSVLEVLRKADKGNYTNADDFVCSLNEDEQVGLAYLIDKAQKSGLTENNLRFRFIQAFRQNKESGETSHRQQG